MSDPTNVVNPGLVNVSDEGYDGFPSDVRASNGQVVPVNISPNNVVGATGNTQAIVVDQEIVVGPSQSAGPTLLGGGSSVTKTVVDQEIQVGPSYNPGPLVQGGTFSPLSPNVQTTTQNTVVNQTYGTGTPSNVFV